ncbi:hypothetical protein B0H13DRAFT_528336 [Mycena leptocephala]|nr:hypothetical protein B0H13DRAFT_528336 [Mycena leptocephala]
MPETASPQQMSQISIVSTPPEERPSAEISEGHEVDGSEEIELPWVIAKRAKAKDDVEQTVQRRRPSTFRRKNSGSTMTSRRPSIAPRISTRSFSEGGGRGRERSISIMSTLQPPTMDRVRSADWEIGVRPTFMHRLNSSFRTPQHRTFLLLRLQLPNNDHLMYRLMLPYFMRS